MAEAKNLTRDAPKRRPSVESVLIIDDHPLFCEALAMTLRTALDVAAIDTAPSLARGLDRVERSPAPDVILLDLKLPDVDGLDGLIRLKRAASGTPVVVVSALCEDRLIASALRAGASGFIPKHSQRAVFASAFERILAGDIFVPEDYRAPTEDTAAGVDASEAVDRLAELTPQQARILQLVCAGKLNKQIAYELDIAETTVKAHLTAILRKLNVHSRTQAVLIAQNARFASILHKESGLS